MEFKDLISPLLTALGMFFGALVIAWKFGLLQGKVEAQHKETMSTIALMETEIRSEFNLGMLKLTEELKHISYRVDQIELKIQLVTGRPKLVDDSGDGSRRNGNR